MSDLEKLLAPPAPLDTLLLQLPRISTTEARDYLRDFIQAVRASAKPLVLTTFNTEQAIVLTVESYRALAGLEETVPLDFPRLTVREARAKLSRFVQAIRQKLQPVVLTHYGQNHAVILPVEIYLRLLKPA